jgi:archaeal flagellin FlaB
MKTLKNLLKGQRGMTGLETAIILIALVTVAAVFGYAVLSTGLFSAEQGKEAIYAGLNEASSNLALSGSVMAMSDDSINVKSILFTVKMAIPTASYGGGGSTVISLTTKNDYLNNVQWSMAPTSEITVDLTNLGPAGPLSETLKANDSFTLQVKPPVGASITIERKLPPAITPAMDLH